MGRGAAESGANLLYGAAGARMHGHSLRTAEVRSLGLNRRQENVLGALLALQRQDPRRAAERRGWTADEVCRVSEGTLEMRSAASVLVGLEKRGLVKSVQSAAMPRVQWFATLA